MRRLSQWYLLTLSATPGHLNLELSVPGNVTLTSEQKVTGFALVFWGTFSLQQRGIAELPRAAEEFWE